MSDEPSVIRLSPAERAAKVEQRINELRQRRAKLAAGECPSAESAELARDRAEESLHRAKEAHHAAAREHDRSARVHERTANTYQRAALRGDDGPPHQLQEKADQHWQAAHDSHLPSLDDEAKAEGA